MNSPYVKADVTMSYKPLRWMLRQAWMLRTSNVMERWR